MNRIFIIISLLIIGGIKYANAQKFEYKIDFGLNFDNLESSPHEMTYSYFGVKFAPEIGVRIDKNNRLMVGFDIIQNMGDSTFPSQIDYTLYYNFNNEKFNVFLGSFPRTYSNTKYPRSFFREDYIFYNTNIEGIMGQYKSINNAIETEFLFDWYGMNKELRIDEFMLVGAFKYTPPKLNYLSFGVDLLLNHFKNEYFLKDAYLLERLQSNVYASLEINKIIDTKFSLLEVKTSLLTSSERKRMHEIETSWQQSPGFQLGLTAIYKNFGISNDYYTGKGQMKYYAQYGRDFYPGSLFYVSEIYNRANLFYMWKNDLLSFRADLIFHITPQKVSNQQMLTFSMNINRLITNK